MTTDVKIETPQLVATGDLFGRFERCAAISAHHAHAEKLEKHAADRRKWADERGPIWQKYLGAAIKLEGQARRHRDRARELSSPNDQAHSQKGRERGPDNTQD